MPHGRSPPTRRAGDEHPTGSRIKAALVWLLLRLWPRWERLAAWLARVVLWVWPGFRER